MKPLVQSWTFWFGAVQVLLGILGLVSQLMDSSAALTLIATGLGSIGLRIKTSTPIGGIVKSY